MQKLVRFFVIQNDKIIANILSFKIMKASHKTLYFFLLNILVLTNANSQQTTYCNPINIDYGYCPIPDFVTQGKHRATADPVITFFTFDFNFVTVS